MKNLLILFSFFILSGCSAQTNPDSRNKGNAILNNFESDGKILLFSISDKWYLVVKETEFAYEEMYINIDKDVSPILIDKISKPFPILNNLFNLRSPRYVNYNTEEYQKDMKTSNGNVTYFILRDSKNIFYEFSSSTIVDPTPIDKEIYYYLVTKLTQQFSK